MEVPAPPQYKSAELHDLRCAKLGPRGYKMSSKRKLDEYEQQVQEEASNMDDQDVPVIQVAKRVKYDTAGVGKVSGRPWKEPSARASTVMKAHIPTPWDKKMQLKAERDAFKTFKGEAIEARKAKLTADRKRREAVKQRKQENQQKSAVVQKITSSATLKKMMKSKKQRKKLQMADTV
ncbi:hypothetical protein WJX72_009383 [[Myrmecia] bisecta]|uniref:Coiled-coil domain-containing protein 86 n=1 Tax=[Myrmecia] bisecta TaxID=41462 RepID=A0AAW1QFZ6_9CHLO